MTTTNRPDYERAYFEIAELLDTVLGTEESDGSGAGIVEDVRLALDRRYRAGLERAADLDALARWLVDLDEPGSAARRTVTLDAVIAKARAALSAAPAPADTADHRCPAVDPDPEPGETHTRCVHWRGHPDSHMAGRLHTPRFWTDETAPADTQPAAPARLDWLLGEEAADLVAGCDARSYNRRMELARRMLARVHRYLTAPEAGTGSDGTAPETAAKSTLPAQTAPAGTSGHPDSAEGESGGVPSLADQAHTHATRTAARRMLPGSTYGPRVEYPAPAAGTEEGR